MSLTFDYAQHEYELDGLPIPGVSEILQGAGLSDPRWFKPEHAQRGHDIHSIIEQYNRAKEVSPGEYAGYLDQYINFLDDWDLAVNYAEHMDYHKLFKYAGTRDIIGLDANHEDIIIDIKSGQPMPWHSLQLCAYGLIGIPEEREEKKNPRIVALYLKEDGYKAVEYDYRDKEVFLSALRIWKWKNWK